MSAVEQTQGPLPATARLPDLADDQARAERVAAARRRRRQLQNFVIRAVSLAILRSALWEIAGAQRRPGAVHHAVQGRGGRRST